jgi:aminoglycoside phosphotransferase (APT) family kinase protein
VTIPAELEDFARAQARSALGAEVVGLEPLRSGPSGAVLLLHVAAPPWRVVLKAEGADQRIDFARTAAVCDLAGSAGVPVPHVLAVDTTRLFGPWSCLLHSHIEGSTWREVRPQLTAEQVQSALRQLAEALFALQSLTFDGFGEFGSDGAVASTSELRALHRRADLRITDDRAREVFHRLLAREAHLFGSARATLVHDDLHWSNVVFRLGPGGPQLAALLDWDKAWAGPAESDVARMSLWDTMTGPAFWAEYRSGVPADEGYERRSMIHQLLWCLEYDSPSARHRADTDDLLRRLEWR